MEFKLTAEETEFRDEVRAFLQRELSWFVGYSELDTGSELANLKTRAVQDGDKFIITGQKAFSSDAHMVDYGWVATRTGPESLRNRGASRLWRRRLSPPRSGRAARCRP